MDNLNQSGIFYFSSAGTAATPGQFPEDCRRTFKSRFEPQYSAIFFSLLVVGFITVGLLSRIKSTETGTSDLEMQKIQERYARLVLNKEIPKKEEPKVDVKAEAAARASAAAAAQAEAAVTEQRKTETVVEKTQRKQASSAQRAAKREAMKEQIGNVGLFAELTAVGTGSGGGSSKGGVRDLIGNIDASSSLSNMSISGASFATKRGESFVPGSGGGAGGRRGERAEGGSISTSGLSSASAGTLKSEGNIEVSNVENIQGEAANDASRDMKTLSQILQKYQPRLKKVYEDFLKRNPDLSGKMVVKFTIEADGSVTNVSVVSSSLNDRELERNIVRYIERIKFPTASGKISIEWPLIFSGS